MIRGRIAQRIEELSAAVRVAPTLGMDAFDVAAHVQEFRPCLIVKIGRLRRPYQVGLSAMSKFDFRAIPAVGAWNEQHGVIFNAPRRLPRLRRSGCRRESVQW